MGFGLRENILQNYRGEGYFLWANEDRDFRSVGKAKGYRNILWGRSMYSNVREVPTPIY